MNNIFIIIPCYNEGTAIISFLTELTGVLKKQTNFTFNVLVIDDYSIDNTRNLLATFSQKNSNNNIFFKIIELPYNVGHQKAIMEGFKYSSANDYSNIIIMDGDGQDNPAAIPQLLEKRNIDIVHVKRGKRNEGIKFRIFYWGYKLLFKILVGKVIDFGNYCIISKNVVICLKDNGFINLPGFLLKQKFKRDYITLDRRERIDGQSKMNFNSLLYHGLYSMLEFAEEFLLFFLRASLIFSVLSLAGLFYVLYEKLFTDTAILGWASTIILLTFICCLLCLGFFFIGLVNLKIYKKLSQNFQQ
jgi:glycosyltransferase involved in cell wall biosynthesis